MQALLRDPMFSLPPPHILTVVYSHLPLASSVNTNFPTAFRPDRNQFSYSPQSGFCHCHRRFGNRALNSRPPCSWSRPIGTPNASHTFSASTDSGGKRDYVGTVKANVVLGPTLFFVHDSETRIRFLVDPGSEHSLLPCRRSAADLARTQWLVAANGNRVSAFESITLTVSLNLDQKFTWQVLRADVLYATIGLDFMRQFGISVSVVRNTLHIGSPSLPIYSSSPPSGSPRPVTGPASLNLNPVPANSLEELFTRYSEGF